MTELVKINFENETPTVSARELHEFLEVKTPYDKWFPRMCEYGFCEERDFSTFLSESTGGRPARDAEAVGSNPVISTSKGTCKHRYLRCLQVFYIFINVVIYCHLICIVLIKCKSNASQTLPLYE